MECASRKSTHTHTHNGCSDKVDNDTRIYDDDVDNKDDDVDDVTMLKLNNVAAKAYVSMTTLLTTLTKNSVQYYMYNLLLKLI